jgi:glycosyltransferase involved in cell wall biosynthesis
MAVVNSDGDVIYCYPYTDVGNTYINKNVTLWRSLGRAVRSTRELWRDRKLARDRKTIVLNWYEDWMLGGSRPQIVSLTIALAMLGFFWLSSSNIIWVRHNFKPHDLARPRPANRVLAWALGKLARTIVTHRPVSGLTSTVVPHSLVQDGGALDAQRDIEFLCFGVVRRYKALDVLLQAWPVERPLVILGKSNDAELTAALQAIIAERGLQVRWENRFIPDDELNDALLRTRYVVLAHEDKSMIVSGAFYHAIACGANILIRAGQFADYNAGIHPFVTTFHMEQLAQDIQQLRYVAPEQVVAAAQQHYGDDICLQSWARLFK